MVVVVVVPGGNVGSDDSMVAAVAAVYIMSDSFLRLFMDSLNPFNFLGLILLSLPFFR